MIVLRMQFAFRITKIFIMDFWWSLRIFLIISETWFNDEIPNINFTMIKKIIPTVVTPNLLVVLVTIKNNQLRLTRRVCTFDLTLTRFRFIRFMLLQLCFCVAISVWFYLFALSALHLSLSSIFFQFIS